MHFTLAVHHGTPLYVAPEILARAQAAKAADVYSYGRRMCIQHAQ